MSCATPACDPCLRRSWLLAALASHIERVRAGGDRLTQLLGLEDEALIAALAGRRRRALWEQWRTFHAGTARERCRQRGISVVCRHDQRYPRPLRRDEEDRTAPAVLHVAGRLERLGELCAAPLVAIVGSRRASDYGLEVARSLARALSAAGVGVVSGLALGIDSAAHCGALEAGGATLAVLGGGADVPYPASKRELYRRIVAAGSVLSELPPGLRAYPWCFLARNRIIATLAEITIVVEGRLRSGALVTASYARERGRGVAAVPGRVTSPLAAGPNALLCDGALLVRDAQDVLDALFGAGTLFAPDGFGSAERPAAPAQPPLEPGLRALLDAIAAGRDTVGALARTQADVAQILSGLAELELIGLVRRCAGGRYCVSGPRW